MIRENSNYKPTCSVGNDETNDLIVHESSVSRRHALIRCHRKKWQVVDGQSTNGTYVGERKAIDWITLHDGQEVRFGAARFIFQTAQALYVRNKVGTSACQARAVRVRLIVVLILAGLIAGFAATQYLIYRSYQQKEALRHKASLPRSEDR